MFSLGGMGELLVILILALLFVGPDQLPEIATRLGKMIRDFRRTTSEIQSQLVEHAQPIVKPLQEIQSALYEDVARSTGAGPARAPANGHAPGPRSPHVARSAPILRPSLPMPPPRDASNPDVFSALPTLRARAKDEEKGGK